MSPHRPSATAGIVALATIAASRWEIEPRPSNERIEITRACLRASRMHRLLLTLLECGLFSPVWRTIERMFAPAFVRHIARRKAWIERACREAIESGCENVVVLGAGLDGLGVVLSRWRPDLRIIEMDHPATQRVKRTAIESLRGTSPTFVPIDLASHDVAPVLNDQAGWKPCEPTLVIAEGLLMYLPPERVERLLDDLAALPAENLRLILTCMEANPGSTPGFTRRRGPAGAWLRLVREPFRWGAMRQEITAMLERHRFRVRELVDEHDLAAIWPGPMLTGEVLIVAEREGTASAAGNRSAGSTIPS